MMKKRKKDLIENRSKCELKTLNKEVNKIISIKMFELGTLLKRKNSKISLLHTMMCLNRDLFIPL